MTMRRDSITLLTFLALAGRGFIYADPPTPTLPSLPAQVLSNSQLVRVAEVNTPSGSTPLGFFGTPIGSDPLSAGTLALTQDRQVTVQLQGAAASAAYTVMFCRFGFPMTGGCQGVGQLNTDGNGNVTASVTFPSGAGGTDTWNGSFVLTRNLGTVTAEFITGFTFPPTPPSPSSGVVLQLTGEIQSINTGNSSFRLAGLAIDIFANNSTKFQGGVHNPGDLTIGDTVQVTGFTQSDGTIFATIVKLTPAPKDND